MGGFNLRRHERQRHHRLQAQHALERRRQRRSPTTSRTTTGSSTSRRPPTRRTRGRARLRRSATAWSRRQDARSGEPRVRSAGFLRRGEGRQFPGGVLHQDAGLSGRPCRLFRSARRAGGTVDAGQLPAAAAGVEEHRGDRRPGTIPTAGTTMPSPSRPARRSTPRPISSNGPGKCGTGTPPAGVERQAGERPLRSRHAHAVPGDLALGQGRTIVSHTPISLASVVRFIEDNWLHGERLGGGSFDATAGSIIGMFDFTSRAHGAAALLPRSGHRRRSSKRTGRADPASPLLRLTLHCRARRRRRSEHAQ